MPLESINIHSKGSGSDFQPTEEEVRSIKDKMNDPEFMKLMTEYMTSLQDPEYRKEEEEYLNQIENEAKNEGDYSFEFIFPIPSFYVELLDVGEENNSKKGKKEPLASRVFINLCTSNKVAEYQEETTGNRDGSHWHIPVSVGRAREESVLIQDNPSKDEKCTVYDAVFHPATMALSERSDKFMTFLVEIAVENINGGYGKQYGYTYRRCSGSMATIKAVGTPANQTIKKEPGKKGMFEVNKTDPVSMAPIKFGTSESSKTNNVSSKANVTKPSSSASITTKTEEDHQCLPTHSITHRGEIDLTDAWNWKGVSDKRIGVPKELIVKINFSVDANPKIARTHPSFTGVKSAADLEVDISPDGTSIELRKSSEGKHPFHGVIVLPFKVEDTPSSAKFEKNKSILILLVRVIAPLLAPVHQEKDQGNAEQEADTVSEKIKPTYNEGESDKSSREIPRGEPNESPETVTCSESITTLTTVAKSDSSLCIPTQSESQGESHSHVEPDQSLIEEKLQTKSSGDMSMPEDNANDENKTTEAPSVVSDASSRMEEVMKRVAMARKEREEAERTEMEDKKDVVGPQKETKDTSGKKDEEMTNKEDVGEETHEVIDLRQRQAEWLKVEKERKEAVEMQSSNNIKGAMEALAKAFEEDDETQEEKARKMEEERKAQKALMDQKKEEAARIEKERLATLMREKLAELPLKSKLIFEIE